MEDKSKKRPKQEIRIITGGLGFEVDKAIEALRQGDANVYQMTGRLVQLIHHNVQPPASHEEKKSRASLTPLPRRPAGALVLHDINETLLTELITNVANFFRFQAGKGGNKESGQWVKTKTPPEYARHILARGEWPLRILRGTVETPTLRPDGTIVQADGYDEVSGLFLDLNGVEFPAIAERPSRGDAVKALRALLDPIATFPFVPVEGERWGGPTASRSVALSAMLTVVVRRSIATAPAHAIVAPTPGTGKTKLAEIAAALATGRKPTAVSYGKTQEEFEKRLFSVLLTGDAVVLIDNIEADNVASDEFCTVLTSEKVKNRILGVSKMAEVSTNSLFLLNGNNVTFRGDIVDRVVICNLDARMEDPKLRVFDRDPVADSLAERPPLVAAVLTVLRAHALAGYPGAKGLSPSRFPDWDRVVRGALVWLGEPDPQTTRDQLAVADPVREAHTAVLRSWVEAVGIGVKVGAGDLVKRSLAAASDEMDKFKWPPNTVWPEDAAEELHGALSGAVDGRLTGQTAGIYLGKMANRVFDGLTIRSNQDKKRGATYWLERM